LIPRIVAYANNTPLLYNKNAKAVPEIHAEALAICRSAARGISLTGCTVYVSFPPCNECFKLLVACGVKRCVFRKGILVGEGQGDAVMVAAEVHGIEMVGTLDRANLYRRAADKEGEMDEKKVERMRDDTRDGKVRGFWATQGEDAIKTRARVNRWWEDWMQRYRTAEKVVHARWGVKGTIAKEKNGDASSKVAEEERLGEVSRLVETSTIPSKRASEDELPEPKGARIDGT